MLFRTPIKFKFYLLRPFLIFIMIVLPYFFSRNLRQSGGYLPAFDASGNHIFYTMEEKKVNGYEGSVQEKCSDEYHWQYIFKNTENTGSLKLFKKSSNPELTEGNECYSLEGAEYGVYEDEACTKSVGKLVTAVFQLFFSFNVIV